MKNRQLRTDRPVTGASGPPDEPATSQLHPGDLVRWGDRLLELTDVVDFAGAGVYVTAVFLNGPTRPPISLRATDLDGAEVWCRVGRLTLTAV